MVLAAAYGIVSYYYKELLTDFGGHISLSKGWVHSLLLRLGHTLKGTHASMILRRRENLISPQSE